MTELQRLLDISTSQHGYWLVNHEEIIKVELTAMLKQHGLVGAASILNEIDNPITKELYTKIEAVKQRRELITKLDAASAELNAYCKPHRNSMGLLPDEFRAGDEYKRLNHRYYTIKELMRSFMKSHNTPALKRAFNDETKRHYGRV